MADVDLSIRAIHLHGCRQHNLRNLTLQIPLGRLTVVTGPSGSGKSSLAFHTLYAEGQRRYVETFSPYVRQFFERMDKPAVDAIEGIPPAIAIEQKNQVRSTRSTVGTLTEINDYLKLLYARAATAFDPVTGEVIEPDSPDSAAAWAMTRQPGEAVHVTFPVAVPAGTPVDEFFAFISAQGYLRILHGQKMIRTDEAVPADLVRLPAAVQVVQDRLAVTSANKPRLLEALEAAIHLGKGHAALVAVASAEGRDDHPRFARAFSTTWTNPATGFTLRPPTPALFSFNSPLGACPHCRGFGRIIGLDLTKAIPDPGLSLAQGAIKPFQGERGNECQRDLLRCCRERGLDIHQPWEDLSPADQEWVNYGDRSSREMSPDALEELWQSGAWYGIKGFFEWLETKAYKMHVRVFLSRYRSYTTCGVCRGQRLQPESLCFKVGGKALPDLWAMPVADLLPWLNSWRTTCTLMDASLKLVVDEIHSRLGYLDAVGLGYLTLGRATRTLSGGEVERVNLTTCLGAALTGTLFVLDEPTVGLHARDIERLVGVMHGLRDKGNTLVVVEHEPVVMHAADCIIDLGPGAGQHGGQLIYQGPPPTMGTARKRHRTAEAEIGTLPWLTGARSVATPAKRRVPGKSILSIRGASRHNLRKLDIDLPLGLMVCLTGVSGSGKSTLAHDVIYQNLARQLGQTADGSPARIKTLRGAGNLAGVERVDQSPVARTPRSTPAVFMGAFDAIRQLFCDTPAAKDAGLQPGYFSFNSGAGRCDRCAGMGVEKVEMQFLSDLFVTCPDCNGRRYKTSALEYLLGGLSVADILDLTVLEAREVFGRLPQGTKGAVRWVGQIQTLLQPLEDVGLGYLRLGQPLNTLSGGESQRLKLGQLLASTGPSNVERGKLLILDEPTTGLHFSDIDNLLRVFNRLVEAGHSLLVIEHNLDVIQAADWILDLGPEAGEHGGRLVAQGPPEIVAEMATPTAAFLRTRLHPIAGTRSKSGSRKSRTGIMASTTPPMISLRGARHHNLKNISLDIPCEQLVVVSGLSGSGKSTLAFDILFAEGQRRFLDSMSAYARQFAGQLEKPEIDQLAGLPPTVAIEQRVSQGGGKSTVATVTEIWNFVRLLYAKLGTLYCPDCEVPVVKQSMAAIENVLRQQLERGPLMVLAPLIRGKKGYHTEVAEWAIKHGFDLLLVDRQFQDAATFTRLARFKEHDIDVVVAKFPQRRRSSGSAPAAEVQAALERALAIGKGIVKLATADPSSIMLLSTHASCPQCSRSFDDLDPRLFSFNSPHGWCPACRGHGRVPKPSGRSAALAGLPAPDATRFDSLLEAELDADRALERLDDVDWIECPACRGSRLHPVAAAVRLEVAGASMPIADVAKFSIDHATRHFGSLRFEASRQVLIARDILPEIRQRLVFLQEVGLGYLALDRSGNTLSGGESQRIRLAAQLGSNLRGVLYVLDEPTIGLHPRDNQALIQTLCKLRDQGNSLVIVEHDEDTIAAADHLIDLGPGAGRFGGEVVYQGSPTITGKRHAAMAQRNSPTLRALSHPLQHPIRGTRRPIGKAHPQLLLTGCRANNLKNLKVAIPLGRLTVVTGISGSGKSTLLHQCLAAVFTRTSPSARGYDSVAGQAAIKACYEVDQAPIGKTSRSCPATYVKVFDAIRALFAQLPESRMRGFDASRFSFNTEGGRCPECKGNGRIKLEMDFLPSTWVHCETCNGQRYTQATMEVSFRDRTISDVLAMTIAEAAEFFTAQPKIAKVLQLMADTGLGYLQLGQASPTLSGGEAQRIKLVAELVHGRSGRSHILKSAADARPANLYLIEEPTVGLHLEDIKRLIEILHRLVDEGHTVVVIEHHMAVAAEADWIIDLGPEAGDLGGQIMAQGTPEHVAKSKRSRTAPFLARALRIDHPLAHG